MRKYLPHYLSRLSASLLIYWGSLLGALWLFAQLAGEVYEKEGFFFDAPVLHWFGLHSAPWLVAAAQTLSSFGSPPVLGLSTAALVTVALALTFWAQRRKPLAALFLTLGLGGAMLLNVLFKLFFARTRPALLEQLTPAPGYSFPSGHAMGSAAFFLTVYLLTAQLFPRWRWLAGTLGALFTLGIGVSRLVLQVHYPSDVLAGWALSAAWVLGLNLVYTRVRHREIQGG